MPAMMRRNGCSISNDSDMECKDAACCCVYVCVSVCLLLTSISYPKTAEPIEIPFGVWTQVGPGNHVLEGGSDPPRKGHF